MLNSNQSVCKNEPTFCQTVATSVMARRHAQSECVCEGLALFLRQQGGWNINSRLFSLIHTLSNILMANATDLNSEHWIWVELSMSHNVMGKDAPQYVLCFLKICPPKNECYKMCKLIEAFTAQYCVWQIKALIILLKGCFTQKSLLW